MSFDFFPDTEQIEEEKIINAPVYVPEMLYYTKPVIYYLCPCNHRVDVFAKNKVDLFCLHCNKLIEKTKCTRMRDYANGTKVIREAGKRPDKKYRHEYYLRRKAGLCKKQKNPHRLKRND